MKRKAMVDRLKPAVDIDEYKSSLYTPLPGHMGPDGKIDPDKKRDEVANHISTLKLFPPDDIGRLANVTMRVLHELYPGELQSYLSEMVDRYADREGQLGFYSSLQGILGDFRKDNESGK